MELASRVFDVVTREDAITDKIRGVLPQITRNEALIYWRRVLRMAALCHDLGHLPFSHAAEKELLPNGWDHEILTKEIILSDEMKQIWDSMDPPLRPNDIVKLAIGPRKAKDFTFSNWEAILSEIIVGDAFGVDRMDYLLRDSYHAGVAYGKFDHFRLIDTLRILPSPSTGEPALGVEEGGIYSAEALLFARYSMYSQVYLHRIRRIYDIHLRDFLRAWLPGGKFSTNITDHLRMTDNEVTVALFEAASDPTKPGHEEAKRIIYRCHFRVLYQRHPEDLEVNIEAGRAVFEAAQQKFDNVRHDSYTQKGSEIDFPVQTRDGRIVPSIFISDPLKSLPVSAIDYVFIVPEKLDEAKSWLDENRAEIIQPKAEET